MKRSSALRGWLSSEGDTEDGALFSKPDQAPPPDGSPAADTGLRNSQSVVDFVNLQREHEIIKQLQRDAARSRAVSDVSSIAGARQTDLAAPAIPVPTLFDVALPLIRQGFTATVDDSFTRCFKSQKPVHWNWNAYLMPTWVIGMIFRYALLLPLRILCISLGFLLVGIAFPIVKMMSIFMDTQKWQIFLIQMLATAFVASWSGVIRIHGIRPQPKPGQTAGVYVANHSSMIDFIILLQSHPYAVVGQKHGGWVGFLQSHLLNSLKCLWFDRAESKDKRMAAERVKSHARNPDNAQNPLLLFPEGTCVNNEYVVQFKKFVFELGVPINPIAIKYSKVFVDAYWNSRAQSFGQHLFRLMSSWAVVCDIWFLDPQMQRPGESGVQFATRVQKMIAARAGLKPVPWDGYMKYWRPSERFIQARQKHVAADLCASMGMDIAAYENTAHDDAGAAAAAAAAEVVPPAAGAAMVDGTMAAAHQAAGQRSGTATDAHHYRPSLTAPGTSVEAGAGASSSAAGHPASPLSYASLRRGSHATTHSQPRSRAVSEAHAEGERAEARELTFRIVGDSLVDGDAPSEMLHVDAATGRLYRSGSSSAPAGQAIAGGAGGDSSPAVSSASSVAASPARPGDAAASSSSASRSQQPQQQSKGGPKSPVKQQHHRGPPARNHASSVPAVIASPSGQHHVVHSVARDAIPEVIDDGGEEAGSPANGSPAEAPRPDDRGRADSLDDDVGAAGRVSDFAIGGSNGDLEELAAAGSKSNGTAVANQCGDHVGDENAPAVVQRGEDEEEEEPVPSDSTSKRGLRSSARGRGARRQA